MLIFVCSKCSRMEYFSLFCTMDYYLLLGDRLFLLTNRKFIYTKKELAPELL